MSLSLLLAFVGTALLVLLPLSIRRGSPAKADQPIPVDRPQSRHF